MATHNAELDLAPDEFAFRFDTEFGVEADEVAAFLQRAATVARRTGADLRVVGVREGSLVIKLRAVAKAAGKEFKKTPLAGTASVFAIGGVIYAIVHAMIPSHTSITPLARAGAQIVEQHQVKTIEVITVNQTFLVMDETRAAQIRMLDEHLKHRGRAPAPGESISSFDDVDVPRLVQAAKQGALSGEVLEVEGELHFRPAGFRFLVPIDAAPDIAGALQAGKHVRIAGQVITRNGQPDRLIVESIFRP
jgi:hypothetical protein